MISRLFRASIPALFAVPLLTFEATRKVQTLPALLGIPFFASLLLGIFILIQSPHIDNSSIMAWFGIAGISVINFIGTLLLYRDFEKGTLSIVSPIGSGFAVVSLLLVDALKKTKRLNSFGLFIHSK
ncbi:hypothetical protein BFP48_08635 [Bacillus altitudinis]|nr:hypothetical protein BFP48_08635 [Bacillus altitudinis]